MTAMVKSKVMFKLQKWNTQLEEGAWRKNNLHHFYSTSYELWSTVIHSENQGMKAMGEGMQCNAIK